MTQTLKNKKSMLGIAMVLIGGFFLLDNLNVFDFLPSYVHSFKMVLIVVGLTMLFVKENKEPGFSILAFGVFLILPDIFNFNYRDYTEYWPLLLVLAGISIMLGRTKPKKSEKTLEFNSLSNLNSEVAFDKKELNISAQEFNGGKVSTVFGETIINLTQARLAEGKHVIDTYTMFGNTEFIVPQDWNVKIDINSIFGGLQEKKFKASTPVYGGNELHIKGTTLFGSAEIKRI